jgi:hypothetical protein
MPTSMSRQGLGKQPEHQDIDATCDYLDTLKIGAILPTIGADITGPIGPQSPINSRRASV